MEEIQLQENIDIYRDFLEYYKPRVSIRGYDTLKNLSRQIVLWFDKKNISLPKVCVYDVLEYKKHLNENINGKFLSVGSICNYLKTARKLFKYMVKMEIIQTNPFMEVKYPRQPEYISRNILKEKQMKMLLDEVSNFHLGKTYKEKLDLYRIHVVCSLLYSTGIRIFEAASLLPEDIDIKRREIIIRCGKGGKSRIAYLTGFTADILDYYIRYGRKVFLARGWRKNANKLFGTDVTTLANAINKPLQKICTRLEIPVITCHAFRHSLGTHLLRAGCDLRHIQLILGHDKINSTSLYTRIERDDLKNILDLYHPRQPKINKDNRMIA